MEISFGQEYASGNTIRTVTVKTAKANQTLALRFELTGDTLPLPTVLDGFVMGIVFFAMGIGENIHVRGAISTALPAHLRELQEAWTLWKPAQYKRIAITADDILEIEPSRPKRALSAFSGGVDSVFTALRHQRTARGPEYYPLDETLVLVHGLDVPLAFPDSFRALKERVLPLAEELGLEIKVVKTNIREAIPQDWEDSHIAQLAACLHNFSASHSYALVASAEPYNALIIPWGSSPLTDGLLSNDAMRIIHDGAGYSRTEKVEFIAKHHTAVKVLKVCWEGPDPSRNCGHCEKCIRTQLNFLAVGERAPPCFDAPLAFALISSIPIRSYLHYSELSSIVDYAKKNGRSGEWLDLLEVRLRNYRPPTRLDLATARARKLITALRRGDVALIARHLKKRIAARRRP